MHSQDYLHPYTGLPSYLGGGEKNKSLQSNKQTSFNRHLPKPAI